MTQIARLAPGSDSPAPEGDLVDLNGALETARTSIEGRFSEAGARLCGALGMVEDLIGSLDDLGRTLGADGESTRDLLTTAESLKRLPDAHEQRVAHLGRLRGAGLCLHEHVATMRETLRYLRAFAVNVKITASASPLSWVEFSGFAEDMSARLNAGDTQLQHFADELSSLDRELAGAMEFERGLGLQYNAMLPAVPARLASDATAIGEHHGRIAGVAKAVAAIARDVQMKVGQALGALQVGDITRQRIEHVQFGLELLIRSSDADLSSDQVLRLRRKVLHLLADQMAETASDFEVDAAKVTQSLAGMAADTTRLLVFDRLNAPADGGLRQLETSLDDATILVRDVHAATENARRIGQETVAAIQALVRRVDAIDGVKRDIQQLTINSSLRCGRLGEQGKALNIIAIELAAHAGRLEAAAAQTLQSLDHLSVAASAATDAGLTHEDEGPGLSAAAARLREAADVVERDLPQLKRQGDDTAWTLADTADRLRLKEELGDVLHAAAMGLADGAGPAVEHIDDIREPLAAILEAIAGRYTMARERAIHLRHAVGGAEMGLADSAGETCADDDILF